MRDKGEVDEAQMVQGRSIIRIAAAAAIAVAASSCSSTRELMAAPEQVPPAPPSTDRRSFDDMPLVVDLAVLTGQLGGDAASGCLWLTQLDGTRGAIVVYSDELRADFSQEPFVLRRADGSRAVGEGDRVVATGGHVDASKAVRDCPVVGEPFSGTIMLE